MRTGKTIRLEESRHGGRVQVKCEPFIPDGATEVVGDIGGHYTIYGMYGRMWRFCDVLNALEAGWSVVES